MSITYGYARVSTTQQDFSIQVDKLKDYGIPDDLIYSDKATGKNVDRVKFKEVLSLLKEGDKLVAYKLDRIARNTKELLILIDQLNDRNIGLVILDLQGEKVDTSTPMGRFFITVLGAVAELERNMILERTQAGIDRAKNNGTKFGRKLSNRSDYETALELYNTGNYTVPDLLKKFSNISERTFYRRLAKQRESEIIVK